MEWWKNAEELRKRLEAAGSMQALADSTGVPRTNLRRWASKFNISISPLNDAEIIVRTLPPHAKRSGLRTPEAILTDHGLDPAEWDVVSYKDNFWQVEQGVTPNAQSKVTAKRRVPAGLLLPARTDGWKPTKSRRKPTRAVELIPLFSDAHAPYQDKGAECCANQWLAHHRPRKAFDLGDLMDFPSPSRHRPTKGFMASPQECINERYKLDRRRVEASPDTEWTVLLGNHDERPYHAVLDRCGHDMATLSRAGEEIPLLDLAWMLRYDELGINVVRPTGDYHSVTVEIVPGLFARHGTKAGKHGGAVKALDRRDSSLAQGHDHKSVTQRHVRYDHNNKARNIYSLSVSAMCSRDLGYMEDPDTAQGFMVISVHKDGSWHPEHAAYDEATRKLYFRDEVYTASPGA